MGRRLSGLPAETYVCGADAALHHGHPLVAQLLPAEKVCCKKTKYIGELRFYSYLCKQIIIKQQ
jgi:hypothetical protein